MLVKQNTNQQTSVRAAKYKFACFGKSEERKNVLVKCWIIILTLLLYNSKPYTNNKAEIG